MQYVSSIFCILFQLDLYILKFHVETLKVLNTFE